MHGRDGADQAIGVSRGQLLERRDEREIGNDAAEDLRVLDLPRHDGSSRAGLAQQANARSQLTERDPVNRGAVPLGGVIELGERLFLHGDDGDVVAQCPRGIEDEKRKPAVAGNQTKCHSVAVPRSGFQVPGSCSRSSSRFEFRVPGSSAEPRTPHTERRTGTLNTNLEHGTWNLERFYSSATSSSVRLVDLRRMTPRCEVRMNSTR